MRQSRVLVETRCSSQAYKTDTRPKRPRHLETQVKMRREVTSKVTRRDRDIRKSRIDELTKKYSNICPSSAPCE